MSRASPILVRAAEVPSYRMHQVCTAVRLSYDDPFRSARGVSPCRYCTIEYFDFFFYFVWNPPLPQPFGISVTEFKESPVTSNTFLWICLLTATSFGPKLGHRQAIIIQESEYIEKLGISKQQSFLLHQGTFKTQAKIASYKQ